MTQVTSGIAEFISRIKIDGVEEGEKERDRIVASAKEEAAKIVAQAEADAKKIRENAEKAAEKRQSQLAAELRMAARDFIFRLQERLKAQAIAPAVAAAVGDATADSELIARLLSDLLVAWGSGSGAVTAHIRPEDRTALETALATRITNGELVLVDEAGRAGFRLERSGDHFAWDFTAEAISRELSSLVEPGLRSCLSLTEPKG
ncbi:MAG: hypothetical protein KC502_12070 [Myxococcales bacterium]|nr:hypothetical protein [Myxococcales bacterium]